jgi:hypothetical protein
MWGKRQKFSSVPLQQCHENVQRATEVKAVELPIVIAIAVARALICFFIPVLLARCGDV